MNLHDGYVLDVFVCSFVFLMTLLSIRDLRKTFLVSRVCDLTFCDRSEVESTIPKPTSGHLDVSVLGVQRSG